MKNLLSTIFHLQLSFFSCLLLMAACTSKIEEAESVRRVVNIDNDWLFTLTNYEAMPYPSTGIADSEALAAIGAADGQWRHLNVPHDWAIEGEFSEKNPSGTGGGALPGGIGWYRKHFTLADLGLSDKADGQLLIRFDGVYMNSTVWLNGHKLGNRPYGYISFEYDMTPYINKEGDNVLAVRVDNSDQPNSRWYSGCGIFRSVYVTAVNPVHIVPWDTYVLPHAPMAEAYKYGESDSLVITIAEETGTRKATSLQARVTIYNKEKKAVFTTETPITNTTIGLRFRIPGAERWSIENPYLYTAQIELNRDGNVIDDYAFRFGIRDFEFNPEQGFRLNGNIYLDMLEVIRENKELEYRTAEAERRTAEVRKLSGAFLIFLVAFIIGFAVLAILARTRHRQFTRRMGERHDERMEQFYDELALHRGGLAENKRAYVRRKASLAIVTSIIPYIDRMRHALKSTSQKDSKSTNSVDLSYVSELAGRIEELNDILAGWIQTRQGIVGLHIETFAVSGLFDILARRRSAFERQGLQLDVAETDAWVKADRALTLFMLNTLTDNARKFTPEGGRISLSTDVKEDYVELSVADTGVGLSEEDIKEILGHKIVDVSRIGGEGAEHGSGFGLMNCKGIIEKYQKTDSFFSVCQLGIDSTPGQGSRFWFRLPKAVRRAMAIVMAIAMTHINANADEQMLTRAAALADSVYYANLEGRYEDAICYGDSALSYLNADLRQRSKSNLDTLTLTGRRGGLTETQWWMSDFETDYYTILDLRNELAIAYLALHQLDNYGFNNRSYTELYKLTSEDTTLADYIARMQQTRRDIVTMLVVGLVVLLAFIIFWWTFIVRPRKAHRRELERRDRELEQMMDEDSEMRRVRYEENRLHVQNMVLDNCLSTIKHETSYYPGRIRKMAEHLSSTSEPDRKQLLDMAELTDFYREIFGTRSRRDTSRYTD